MNWPAASGAGVAAGAGFLAWAVRGRSSNLIAPSVWRGDPHRVAVALTFDDGPSESTPAILDILARENARATFFECGQNVRRLPSVAREVLDAGHEIGNHTETHPRLWLQSPGFIRGEIARAQQSIQEVSGVVPRLFRPPYGVRWFGLRRVQRDLDLAGVMWTVIALDWKLPVAAIVDRLLQGARKGAIFCLHDGRALQKNPNIRETTEALRRVLPILRDKGYDFETVSQIICPTT